MPKVSYIVLFYNQQQWVSQSVEAAFSQNYRDVEFIFSDDGSTDATFENLLAETEKSKVRDLNGNEVSVRCWKQPQNLGIVEHINAVLEETSGDFIALVAGDDVPLSRWVSQSVTEFERDECVSMVSSSHIRIDREGRIVGRSMFGNASVSMASIARSGIPPIPGAGTIWRREVFFEFGPISGRVQNEDDQLIARAAVLGEVKLLENYQFLYRIHSTSLSSWQRNIGGRFVDHFRHYRMEVANRIEHANQWEIVARNLQGHEQQTALSNIVNCRDKLIHELNKFDRIEAGYTQASTSSIFRIYSISMVLLLKKLHRLLRLHVGVVIFRIRFCLLGDLMIGKKKQESRAIVREIRSKFVR